MSEQQFNGQMAHAPEWPTREQMERVQEFAAEGVPVRVERHGADGMMLMIGAAYTSRAVCFDVDGKDVTEEVTRPTQVGFVELPLDLVSDLLGADVVAEAIAHTANAGSREVRLGHELSAPIAARVRELLGA